MKKEATLQAKGKDSFGFKILKLMAKVAIRRPEFIYLGDHIKDPSLILTNHVGSRAPLTLELYAPFKTRLLGIYLMNGNLKQTYKYLSEIYYHQKKKINIVLAKLWCLIAAPLVYGFYHGLKLISVYEDYRFLNSVKDAYKVLTDFKENLVFFPEDSSKGYYEKLTHFYSGFLLICDYAFKKGIDIDIFVAYLRHKERKYIFDKPIKYSQLIKKYEDKDEIIKKLLDRCNELGVMDIYN